MRLRHEQQHPETVQWSVTLDEIGWDQAGVSQDEPSQLVEMEQRLTFDLSSSTAASVAQDSVSFLLPLLDGDDDSMKNQHHPSSNTRTLVVALWEEEMEGGETSPLSSQDDTKPRKRRRLLNRQLVQVPRNRLWYERLRQQRESSSSTLELQATAPSSVKPYTVVEITAKSLCCEATKTTTPARHFSIVDLAFYLVSGLLNRWMEVGALALILWGLANHMQSTRCLQQETTGRHSSVFFEEGGVSHEQKLDDTSQDEDFEDDEEDLDNNLEHDQVSSQGEEGSEAFSDDLSERSSKEYEEEDDGEDSEAAANDVTECARWSEDTDDEQEQETKPSATQNRAAQPFFFMENTQLVNSWTARRRGADDDDSGLELPPPMERHVVRPVPTQGITFEDEIERFQRLDLSSPLGSRKSGASSTERRTQAPPALSLRLGSPYQALAWDRPMVFNSPVPVGRRMSFTLFPQAKTATVNAMQNPGAVHASTEEKRDDPKVSKAAESRMMNQSKVQLDHGQTEQSQDTQQITVPQVAQQSKVGTAHEDTIKKCDGNNEASDDLDHQNGTTPNCNNKAEESDEVNHQIGTTQKCDSKTEMTNDSDHQNGATKKSDSKTTTPDEGDNQNGANERGSSISVQDGPDKRGLHECQDEETSQDHSETGFSLGITRPVGDVGLDGLTEERPNNDSCNVAPTEVGEGKPDHVSATRQIEREKGSRSPRESAESLSCRASGRVLPITMEEADTDEDFQDSSSQEDKVNGQAPPILDGDPEPLEQRGPVDSSESEELTPTLEQQDENPENDCVRDHDTSTLIGPSRSLGQEDGSLPKEPTDLGHQASQEKSLIEKHQVDGPPKMRRLESSEYEDEKKEETEDPETAQACYKNTTVVLNAREYCPESDENVEAQLCKPKATGFGLHPGDDYPRSDFKRNSADVEAAELVFSFSKKAMADPDPIVLTDEQRQRPEGQDLGAKEFGNERTSEHSTEISTREISSPGNPITTTIDSSITEKEIDAQTEREESPIVAPGISKEHKIQEGNSSIKIERPIVKLATGEEASKASRGISEDQQIKQAKAAPSNNNELSEDQPIKEAKVSSNNNEKQVKTQATGEESATMSKSQENEPLTDAPSRKAEAQATKNATDLRVVSTGTVQPRRLRFDPVAAQTRQKRARPLEGGVLAAVATGDQTQSSEEDSSSFTAPSTIDVFQSPAPRMAPANQVSDEKSTPIQHDQSSISSMSKSSSSYCSTLSSGSYQSSGCQPSACVKNRETPKKPKEEPRPPTKNFAAEDPAHVIEGVPDAHQIPQKRRRQDDPLPDIAPSSSLVAVSQDFTAPCWEFSTEQVRVTNRKTPKARKATSSQEAEKPVGRTGKSAIPSSTKTGKQAAKQSSKKNGTNTAPSHSLKVASAAKPPSTTKDENGAFRLKTVNRGRRQGQISKEKPDGPAHAPKENQSATHTRKRPASTTHPAVKGKRPVGLTKKRRVV